MSKYQRILVAIDLEQETQRIIDSALSLTSDTALIKVIHVVLPLSQAFYANGLGLVQPMVDLVKLENDIIEKATADLDHLVSAASPTANIVSEVKKGDVVEMIVDEAKDYHADVIVLGSHGTSGIKLLLGSTANGVLHHAPCDTLMVKL